MVRKYTAQVPMQVVPTGAKAWPEAMSRERRAMAGFGMTGAYVAVRWQQERNNLEVGKNISSLNNYQFTLMRQLEESWKAKKFTDPKQFEQAEKDYEKARESFLNKLLKGKRGAISDRVREYADSAKVRQAKEFYGSLFSKEKEFNSVEGLKVVESAILRGDRKEALMQIDEFSYWFGPTKTKYLRDTLDARMIEVQHQNFLEQVAVDAREMNITDALSAINKIPRTAISEAERNGLIAQRKRQEEIATSTTNRKVRWDVLRQVTKDPKSVTDEWLEGLVKPNSLTWDDAEEFKKIRDDANEPLKTPRAQLYFNSLDTLFDKRETDDEQRLNYDIANEKLVQFFETTKTPTAKQAAEFYDELTDGEVRGILNKAWDIWVQSPFGVGYRKIAGIEKEGKEKSPYPEYPDAFLENGVWKVIKDGKKYRIE